MKRKTLMGKLTKGIYHYLLFFLLTAFLVTCTTSLFVTVLSRSLDLELTGDNLQTAAKLTFLNVLVLSVLFTAIDAFRRRFTTERVTKHITSAAREIVKGDFDVRIEPINSFSTDENYNVIIDCFNTMASELSSVETLRADFVSNVSHEMKTPLTVVQNYGTLLQTPDLSEEKRIEYAKGVTEASRRLSDMMTNILKLNRLENQQIYPQTERYDLGEQLCECFLQFENVWESKDIEISTEIADGIIVSADAELLSLVWNNLFSNAFKFTEKGGNVSLTLEADGDFAVVKVEDTGCGMSAEVGEHIFGTAVNEITLESLTIPTTAISGIAGTQKNNKPKIKSVIVTGSGSIPDQAFWGCRELESVVISDGVTGLGKEAFRACNKLTSITLPEGVTSIGPYAFYECYSVFTEIVIPASVTSIGYGAFSSCDALRDVYFAGSEDEWAAIEIAGLNDRLNAVTIHYNYVPAGE